ncbi:MAG: PKD domain-containing protein, partial [Bacteroidota bacterium]
TGCVDSAEVPLNYANTTANFSLAPKTGCAPLTVNFSNLSIDADAFFWDFGDGNASFSNNNTLSHTYTTPGRYTVTLGVRSTTVGCVDTLRKIDSVIVLGPIVDFESPDTLQCSPSTVNFTDLTIPNGGALVSWTWDFGDPFGGNISGLQNPTYTYDSSGVYDVRLIVRDINGCVDTLIKPAYVAAIRPVADFSANTDTSCLGALVDFVSLAQGISPIDHLWIFGPAATDTSQQVNPSWEFPSAGFHDVTLIVVDSLGCSDTLFRPNYIYIDTISADFDGNPRIGICPPHFVTFDNLSTGTIDSLLWDFGDGKSAVNLNRPANTYDFPGKYDVTLVAIHPQGCRDTVVKEEFIEVAGPFGIYTIMPANGCLMDTTFFTVIVDSTASLVLDYGDGNIDIRTFPGNVSDTIFLSHIYQNVGTYLPELVLTDVGGCQVTLPRNNSVTIFSLPEARITPADTIGCTPFSVVFSDSTTLGDTTIRIWNWNFGDGKTDTVQNPVNVYDSSATFIVSLLVIDENGCSDSATAQVTALPSPEADFFSPDTFNCSPLDAAFIDQSQGGAGIVNWFWDFGDGTTGNVQNPVHTYPYQGDTTYDVTLVVTDGNGCVDTLTRENYIRLRHPDAYIYANDVQGCNPVTLTFYADSTTSDTTLIQYQWTFGPGTQPLTASTTPPVDTVDVTYNTPGTYDVRLIVTDELGCRDTMTRVDYITIDQTLVPDPLSIIYVSVIADDTVEISHQRYPDPDFSKYEIYWLNPGSGQYEIIDSVFDQNQTTYLHGGPFLDCVNNSYCYKVVIVNSCLEAAPINNTPEHCTMVLSSAPGVDLIQLQWTDYIGWEVDSFDVFRVESYDVTNHVLIATVPGTQLAYEDTETFCEDSSFYRVQAREQGTLVTSFSNVKGDQPIHFPPDESVDISTATVVADSFVFTNWEPYTGYRPEKYILEKSEDGLSYEVLEDSLPITSLSYSDLEVNVDEQSYFYRVFAEDICGDRTLLGRYGKTILLNAELNDEKNPVLQWSMYEEWERRVESYIIEVFNENTQAFERVDRVSGGVNVFEDVLTVLDQVQYCYRITAIERVNGREPFVSQSNIDCIIFSPRIFTPNAFTPNGDDRNDRFIVQAPGLVNGSIQIFNRWGREVYASDNLDQGWDGTFNGRHAPEGVYVFIVRGVGLQNEDVEKRGTITLIR